MLDTDSKAQRWVKRRLGEVLTVVGDGLGRPLLRLSVPLLVPRLPGVVDFEPAVELLPAGGQELDV